MDTTDKTDKLEVMAAVDNKDVIEFENDADLKLEEETNFTSNDNCEINVKSEVDNNLLNCITEEANVVVNVNKIEISEASVNNVKNMETTESTEELEVMAAIDNKDVIDHKTEADDKWEEETNFTSYDNSEINVKSKEDNKPVYYNVNEEANLKETVENETNINHEQSVRNDICIEITEETVNNLNVDYADEPHSGISGPESSRHCERCALSFSSQEAFDDHKMLSATHADERTPSASPGPGLRRSSRASRPTQRLAQARASAALTVPATKLVGQTAGGSIRPTGESVPVVATAGGTTRRRTEKSNAPLCAEALIKVEAMDLTDEEGTDGALSGTAGRVRRGISDMGRELECPEPSSVSPKNSTNSQTGNAPNVPNVSSVEVDVRPSTSGSVAASKPVLRSEANDGSDLDSDDDEFDVAPIQSNAIIGLDREIPDDAEVDELTQEALDAVQRAMDVEAERLLGESNVYEWKEGFETFRGRSEPFTGPTPGPLKDYDTPYDAFVVIWSKDIMEVIVRETNRYAKQTIDRLRKSGSLKPSSRLHKWHDTDVDEMMMLFAVYMFMGIDARTSQEEYWRVNTVLEMPKFRQLMPYNRYVLLSKFLHFIDNSDVSRNSQSNEEVVLSPKLAKLAPVTSHLNYKFSSLYNLESNFAIDESLTLFKGRLSWIQAIRSKAARFGIKSYELCESHTGYLYKFRIYTGRNSEGTSTADASLSADLGDKSTKIVLDLLKGLERRGHCVTMDSFYNSPALARYLKSLGFDCLGTLNPNRKNVPRDIAKIPKNVAKGTIVARHCGDVSVLAWKDTRVVNMISTYHGAETYVGSKAGQPLVKPVCVADYNHTMGGVDLKDQKLSTYLVERKRGVKWYIKMFKRMLNVSIHNAFILHRCFLKRSNLPLTTHREFRYELANSIVEKHRASRLETPVQVDTLVRLRKDLIHVPSYTRGSKNRKRCGVCYRHGKEKRVHTQCVTCGEYLCFENCWKEWHSSSKLKEVRSRPRKRRRNE